MEAIEIAVQQMLATSPGDSVHTDNPVNPGGAMSPGLFDDPAWGALLDE